MANIHEIEQLYRLAFEQFEKQRAAAAAPPITVEFYEYVGLRHTIRIREGKVFVRLSDLIKDAPLAIQKALALILVAKLLRRRVPKPAATIYKNFVTDPQTIEKSQTQRRERARKIITSAQGRVYDLNNIFARVNETYFDGSIAKPILSWSTQKTFRIFGHHDALHETIVISQTLDDARVPQFVVEFVVYHELLHIKHPTKIINGRRQIHSAAFRRDEQAFPHYEEAEKWLGKIARRSQTTLTRARRRGDKQRTA